MEIQIWNVTGVNKKRPTCVRRHFDASTSQHWSLSPWPPLPRAQKRTFAWNICRVQGSLVIMIEEIAFDFSGVLGMMSGMFWIFWSTLESCLTARLPSSTQTQDTPGKSLQNQWSACNWVFSISKIMLTIIYWLAPFPGPGTCLSGWWCLDAGHSGAESGLPLHILALTCPQFSQHTLTWWICASVFVCMYSCICQITEHNQTWWICGRSACTRCSCPDQFLQVVRTLERSCRSCQSRMATSLTLHFSTQNWDSLSAGGCCAATRGGSGTKEVPMKELRPHWAEAPHRRNLETARASSRWRALQASLWGS